MQQFRPLPRFDEIEEAEPVEVQQELISNTDPIPVLPPETPRNTDPLPIFSQNATGRIPIVLLSGPHPTVDTDRLAALVQKPASTGKHASLTSALQATMGSASVTRPLTVIHADPKRKKKAARSSRRLNPRLRQLLMLIITLAIIIGALTTLGPLSDGQIFSGIGSWIHTAQIDWEIQAHQGDIDIPPSALNAPGLPYMPIANSPYVRVAEQDALDAGIPPVYFVRQIQQESGFNPNAVSITNAQGIAQFEPYTAAPLGINPWDPVQALRGAANLMGSYYRQYNNYAKALAAYNAGPGAVQSASYACGLNWLSCMPGQTQNYVYRIMGV